MRATRPDSLSNCARFAAVPLDTEGTSLATWRDAAPLPRLGLEECRTLVIVGAHPDDETLGLGATAAQLAARGVDVQVVSASDGGAAHPEASCLEKQRLARERREELRVAAHVLGLAPPITWGLPDGRLGEHENDLADRLADVLGEAPAGTCCAAPWRGDGHPDHEAVGRAAAAVAARVGAPLLEYPIWMWHWAQPRDPAVPWDRAFSIDLSPQFVSMKRHAALCFQSQFRSFANVRGPVLPAFVVSRLLGVGEIAFTNDIGCNIDT
jgi:LmbE family N-acetylglucosaminyl deacetylase